VTSSAIDNALATSATLMTKLAAVNSARASSQNNNTLNLIQTTINNQANTKIAALQVEVPTATVDTLQQQETALNTQLGTYQTAEGQLATNNSLLGDLSIQLANLATAAQAGDSTTFDQTLASAQNDVSELQTVSFAPGLLQDGTAGLQYNGLNIQSSSSYDLSTPAGQAAAISDVQAAVAQVQQISTLSSLNQTITASAQTSLQTQISGINTQVVNLQTASQTQISQQTSQIRQQAQEEFHIIEMNLGNAANAGSLITSVQNYRNLAAAQPGTTLALLGGTAGEPSLPVANLTTSSKSSTTSANSSSSSSSTASSNGGTSNSQLGSLLSTSA
jgi:hypothetical protein